jgi:photosystem II stability/assembly factor-like uncharacterized protein
VKYVTSVLLLILLLAVAGCSSSDKDLLAGERLALPTTNAVSGIFFVDGETGFAVTAVGEVFKTADGGKTFNKLDVGGGGRGKDVYFLNDEIGFVFGAAGYLMRTADAGKSWSRSEVDSTIDLRDLIFLDKEHGFLVGVMRTSEQAGGGAIGRSADKGLSWKFESSEYTEFRMLSVAPRDHVWIIGSDGTTYSTDRGASWAHNSGQSRDSVRAACFSDIVHGWMVGDRGLIRNSSDGGWSWKDANRLSSRDLSCLAVPDLDVIYLAGDRFLGATTNHGRKWWVDTLSYTNRFYDCQSVGKEVFVAGSGGTIIKLKR